MIGGLVRGAMDLARPIEFSVQTGWTISVSFEWLLSLTGFDRPVFVIVSMLVLVASWLAIVVPGFGGAWVAGAIASTR